MPNDNMEMLQIVANGLEELKEEVVFVGGAVAELYADDPAASDIRPTQDVDCVIELGSRSDYDSLESELRRKGFDHDVSPDAPVCRKVFQEIKVDVMPTDSSVIGFSNRWYSDGIEKRIPKTLSDGTEISVFPPEYYLAVKFEAHMDRGGGDLRQSHDFEDIIYILHNCSTILEDIQNADQDVKEYLIEMCQILLDDDNITEGIESALPIDSDSDSTEHIEDLLNDIANITSEQNTD